MVYLGMSSTISLYHTNIKMTFYPSIPSPCFVLEENLLIANLELLKKVQIEAGVEIICALKGFSFYHEFPLVKQYLAGANKSCN